MTDRKTRRFLSLVPRKTLRTFLTSALFGLVCVVATPPVGAEQVPEQGQGQSPKAQADANSEEAMKRLLETARVFDEPGVLTPPGKLVVEPFFDYYHSSVNRVAIDAYAVLPAIAVGNIDISKVSRDTISTGLTLRYGLARRTEIAAKVPYVQRWDRTTSRPIGTGSDKDETTGAQGSGLGDIEMSIHRQLNRGGGEWPYLVANLRVKSTTGEGPYDVDIPKEGLPSELPTGSGFWALQPSLSALLPSDPVVFFASVSYMWTIARETDSVAGRVDPGDVIGANLGMGFAINERISFSIGFEENLISRTKQEDLNVGDRLNVATLQFGGSYRVSDAVRVNVSVIAGLTEDSPDMQVSLRVPVTF